MIPAKSYLITINEGDVDSLFDRCLERAFKKRIAAVPVISDDAEPDELLTPDETAKLLKISKPTLWDWTTKRGILKKHTIANQVRYLRSEVMEAVLKRGKAV